MRIANPLYDHAFKYLMSNDRLAKKVLTTILEQEVLELELSQQEVVVANHARQFTLFRLDFKAIILNEAGKKEQVMIELQKSKLPTNLVRFRNYLGYSYTQSNKEVTGDASAEETLLPIISIYILGYNLPDVEVMAATVDRKIIDASTKQELHIESDFIELLTHKCHILQVRRLPPKRQTRIEQFLALFNQAWVTDKKYILDLEEVSAEFKDIATYLQRPLQDKATIEQLRAEAEVEDLFSVQEALIKRAQQEAEEERKLKEEAIQKEKEAIQKEKIALLKLAQQMKKYGESTIAIQEATGLTIVEIEELE